MNTNFSITEFYEELKTFLPTSSAEKRIHWARTIIEKEIELKDLSNLLKCDYKIASRFLWLLSDIGTLNSAKLFIELPFLFALCDQINPIYKISFATFWLIAGVPPENEGVAIDLLFQWILLPDTNVTMKSRSILVLFKLTEKYPELKNELKLCLKDQLDKHTNNFEKRTRKILLALEQDLN